MRFLHWQPVVYMCDFCSVIFALIVTSDGWLRLNGQCCDFVCAENAFCVFEAINRVWKQTIILSRKQNIDLRFNLTKASRKRPTEKEWILSTRSGKPELAKTKNKKIWLKNTFCLSPPVRVENLLFVKSLTSTLVINVFRWVGWLSIWPT